MPSGAEKRQSAENTEEKKQHRQSKPIADQQRFENIVDHADDSEAPDQQPNASKGFSLQEQINRHRHRYERRAADGQ